MHAAMGVAGAGHWVLPPYALWRVRCSAVSVVCTAVCSHTQNSFPPKLWLQLMSSRNSDFVVYHEVT
jgi:hypothetical protein